MRREWFPVSCGRAGVEEIMGFGIPFRGSGEWYGYAFGLPDRHPRLVVACGFRMPLVGRRGPVGLWVGSWRGAWWFENWIVDASNAMNSVSSFALSRFRQALFWSLVSRSIVL